MGLARKAFTRSSISTHSRETWLLDMPDAPIGLLDHGRERLLGRAARLEEGREVRALAQLGDGEVDPACPGVPGPLAIAVAVIEPLGAAHARWRAGQVFDLQCHQPFGRKGQHRAHKVGISVLLDRSRSTILSLVIVISGIRFKLPTRTLTEDRR